MLIEYGCPFLSSSSSSSSSSIMFPEGWKWLRDTTLFVKRIQRRCYTVNTGHFRRPSGWSSSVSFKTPILKICFCLTLYCFRVTKQTIWYSLSVSGVFARVCCLLHPWSKYEQDPSRLADVLYEVPAACNHCCRLHEKKLGWLFLNVCRSSSASVGLRHLNAVDNYAVRKITYMITCKQKMS